MSEVILVTQQEFSKGEPQFRECTNFTIRPAPADEAVLAQAIREYQCCAVIVGVQPFHGPLYEALAEVSGQRGALIARFGVGHDSIDKALLQQHGITLTNTPGVLDDSVAEHTMWLMGGLARHVGSCHSAMKSAEWKAKTGSMLRGKTLGILGFGSIGRRVAGIAAFGFGMRVIAAGRSSVHELEQREDKNMETLCREYGVSDYTNDIQSFTEQADIISIHLPATDATKHFVNAALLGNMKKNALFVNTSRGSIVDECALFNALAAGNLAGAALDVYEQEPYTPVSPECDLRTLPNVLLTPHIGSNTVQANEAMARASLANAIAFLEGNLSKMTRIYPEGKPL